MIQEIGSDKKTEVNDTETYNNGIKVVPSYLLDPVTVDQGQHRARSWSTRGTTPRTSSSR